MGLDKVCYGGCAVQSGVVLTLRANREAASLRFGWTPNEVLDEVERECWRLCDELNERFSRDRLFP
jgi:hypothetical protein